MAELQINIKEIRNNIKKLNTYFRKKGIKWSLITKVFSGDKDFLRHILTPDIIKDIHSVGDSRLSNLKNLKEINPELTTIYIKPPAMEYVDDVVKYADISMNSSYETIEALNTAAQKIDKMHQIIVMIELGELREGVNRKDFTEFYKKTFNLSNIKVVGIGSNLGCMYGIEPTYDKLLHLSLYKEIVELKHDSKLDLISGGTSITLPLVEQQIVPRDINHFRIGEAAFFGTSPLNNKPFLTLNTHTFKFCTNIIELEEKSLVPDGVIGDASIGHSADFTEEQKGETTFKAILDFGLLDVDHEGLTSSDSSIKLVGITSDMTVIEIGDNLDKQGNIKYKVGDMICLQPNYIAVARLLNSKFIEKRFVN